MQNITHWLPIDLVTNGGKFHYVIYRTNRDNLAVETLSKKAPGGDANTARWL